MKHLMLCLLALIVATGCAKKVSEESGAAARGETGKPGTFLAYEHTVGVGLAGDALPARLEAVREACVDERFGSCSVLEVSLTTGDYPRGALTVRLVPDGVEPLVTLAGEGGRVGSRETRAEDLAEAVADTAQQRERLELQRAKLLEFQARKDLSVADMLAIASELASIETQLQDRGRTAAEQQRRLETNLLTIRFWTDAQASGFSRIGDAFGDALDASIDGVAEAIEWLAFGLPFLVVAFPLALFWRWLWQRATRRRGKV